MSVLKKIQKRRNYTVDVDGEPVHLRSLSYSDAVAIDAVASASDKVFYALGCALLEDDGTPAIPRQPEETAQQYVDRVRVLTQDMQVEVMKQLSAAITKITKVPDGDAVVKNSEPTDTPAS